MDNFDLELVVLDENMDLDTDVRFKKIEEPMSRNKITSKI